MSLNWISRADRLKALPPYVFARLDELKAIFQTKVPHPLPLIFSCGSGVTACILCLGAELVGLKNLKVYDGSWSEWGLPSDRTVVTGKE
jgi:thiosulfate/3-mercaptopyruvate sulfurtransferase